MGVYIPYMEMPDECMDCPFYVRPYEFYESPSWCHVLGKASPEKSDCPLVALPEHGDLIDQRRLINIGMHLSSQVRGRESDMSDGVKAMLYYVIEAPVVLMADDVHGGDYERVY